MCRVCGGGWFERPSRLALARRPFLGHTTKWTPNARVCSSTVLPRIIASDSLPTFWITIRVVRVVVGSLPVVVRGASAIITVATTSTPPAATSITTSSTAVMAPTATRSRSAARVLSISLWNVRCGLVAVSFTVICPNDVTC